MTIYQPQEDSEFLAQYVREYAQGKVLDMGTGSGIQAITAAQNKNVTAVIATDKNPAATLALQEKIKNDRKKTIKKIIIQQSDMFSKLQEEKFDTIICNPPYLPDDKNAKDIALDGGPKGYEWSIAFLKQAKDHLQKNGQLLFLFSSLTNKERIDNELKKLRYAHEEIGMLALGFFEKLYVYQIWRKA